MCGIAGILRHDSAPLQADVFERMGAMLAHRGPDDKGFWGRPGVGIVHRRLSVIDPTPLARQPMANTTGLIQVAFNGEIYNFRSLRDQLQVDGEQFRTRSDTEVIVRGYERWGDGVLQRLNGMFALAIWDETRRRLLLARDRLGEKPLYYFSDAAQFCFSSEIKALLVVPGVPREPDPQSIDQFLTYQYVPAPRTAFRSIFKLCPAHLLSISIGNSPQITRYWELTATPSAARSESAVAEELRGRLEQAVRARMVSDVPLGAFLSGGIDSSAVVAYMAQASSTPIKTFSIGFNEAEYSELEHARTVATHFGTDHAELIVTPNSAEILPRIVWHYGEPFGDSSAIPTFYLAEFARRSVTVALNGDGGDESFAGYPKYARHLLLAPLDDIPLPLRRLASGLRSLIPSSALRTRSMRLLHRFLAELPITAWQRYGEDVAFFSVQARDGLYTQDFKSRLADTEGYRLIQALFERSRLSRFADAQLFVDLHTYLPDDLLMKVDVATMAHSLEGRAPLLDPELVQFAAGLPMRMKVRGRKGKYILRRALRDLLPRVSLRRAKQGFGVPIDRWLRSELAEMTRDVLLGSRGRLRGLFEPQVVATLLDEHQRGIRRHEGRIWLLLMLELWFRMWIDEEIRSTAPALS